MAHYAFIDENNVVVNVIVGIDEGHDGIDWEKRYSEISGMTCKRTSYNTIGGKHTNNGEPFRKNYAGIGYVYMPSPIDAFVPPKPYPSWVLDEQSCLWQPPAPYPDDGGFYEWDEATFSWVIPAA